MSEPSDARAPGESPEAAPPSRKPRNPVERALVWGLILALLVVTAVEARARLAYSQSLSRLQDAITAAEATQVSEFKIDHVPALLAGSPSEHHESRRFDQLAHYRWNGLFKQYGLHVSYGTYTKVVTGVTSDDPPADPHAAAAGDGDGDAAADDPSGAEGQSESGGGGERRRFDPLQADADGDGKLSREEAPGRLGENFDAVDKNSDGFLDAAELEARRRERSAAGPNGGGGAAPPAEAAAPDVAPAPQEQPATAPPTAPQADEPGTP
jgi:hypothetical protein